MRPLSIVIPCHDGAALLSKTLAGIAAQGNVTKRIEIILVDNNSKTDSMESVHRRFMDVLNITLIQQPRLRHPFSLCRARNMALRLTTADWILSLDSDCIPDQGHLAAVLKIISSGDTASVYTGERVFISSADITVADILHDALAMNSLKPIRSASNYRLPLDRRMPIMKQLPNVSHPWAFMHAGNLLYPVAKAREIGGHDEAFDGHWGYEDAEFAYRIITGGGCAPRFSSEMRVFHQEPTHVTSSDYKHKLDKRNNPNWVRACEAIPGFREFKIEQFRDLGAEIII